VSLHRRQPELGADGSPRPARVPRARVPLSITRDAVHNQPSRDCGTPRAGVGPDLRGTQGMVTTRANAHSYIIKRPRLTRLLDESEARIILLCAPAGYGKTTLAREWAGSRTHVLWYPGSPELRDVAGVLEGLTGLFERTAAASGPRLSVQSASRKRSPREAGRALASYLRTPADSLFVIDDYHFAVGSTASEELLASFVASAEVRFVITSRLRPSWIASRDEVYGNATVLGPSDLAFTREEAMEVFQAGARLPNPSFFEHAHGWPAVIGLAARGGTELPGAIPLPTDLFEFLAEDVFSAGSPQLREALYLMGLAGTGDERILEQLTRQPIEEVATEATGLGLATRGEHGLILHPLVRTYLLTRLRRGTDASPDALVGRAIEILSKAHLWDECLEILERFPYPELIVEALTGALRELAVSGRVATIARWVELARRISLGVPIVVLADAEVRYRAGDAPRALALGQYAAEAFGSGEHAAQAHLIAAMAAQMLSDERTSEFHATQARELSAENATVTQTRWLELLRCVEQGEVEAARSLAASFINATQDGASDSFRAHNAQAFVEFEVNGDVHAAADALARGFGLLPYVLDPLQRTNFLNLRGAVLLYLADYEEALRASDELIAEAKSAGLDFVVDHALIMRAGAEVGLRRFGLARKTLAELRRRASRAEFIRVQTSLKEAMLRLATGDLARAEALLSAQPPSGLSKAIPGEWLGLRALVRAPSRPPAQVQADIDAARESLPFIDARDFAELAGAILALRKGGRGASRSTAASITKILDTGHRDAIVHAVRAYPNIVMATLSAEPSLEDELTRLLSFSRDVALGRMAGLKMPREQRPRDGLSPRERDVYELIRQGRTNPEIAAALFISNSTVKVHVRHIYEKLGVHSRAEAAAAGREGN